MAQKTSLGAAITTTNQASIAVADFLGFPSAGAFSILIDSEVLRVTAGNGTTTWTVTRGYAGTTAATHLINATVSHVSDGSVINLGMAKTYLAIPDTDDDTWLPYGVDAINRAINRGIGVDLGPSVDATRYYDGSAAVVDRTRIRIPGGIRSFSTVSVTVNGGTSWTAVTSDVRIGPASWMREPGEPGRFIEFIDIPTGSYRTFPAGTQNVRIVGTAGAAFGWDDNPGDLEQGGLAALQRLYADRDGRGNFPTETDAARYLNPATINHYRGLYFPRVR